jgi:prophage regulatory protein
MENLRSTDQANRISLWSLKTLKETLDIGHSTIYLRVKQGLLPPPIKLGHPSRWPSVEIGRIIAAYAAGQSDDEIRSLVCQMVQDRLTGRWAQSEFGTGYVSE